MTNNDVVFYYT